MQMVCLGAHSRPRASEPVIDKGLTSPRYRTALTIARVGTLHAVLPTTTSGRRKLHRFVATGPLD